MFKLTQQDKQCEDIINYNKPLSRQTANISVNIMALKMTRKLVSSPAAK